MENFNKNLGNIEEIPQKPVSRKKYYIGFLILLVIIVINFGWYFLSNNQTKKKIINNKSSIVNNFISPSPTPDTLTPIPSQKILSNGGYHIFQSFNNCGPAALSMALRFYGINVSQEELGQSLRPYQIPGGDNDDKSVTLVEVANKSKEYGFTPYLRPMGNEEIIKQFIAQDIPVITRTWTKPTEDIGHYRIIKGYDDNQKIFIQDVSLQGKDLDYAYADFDKIWKKFNYEYLVLVPKEKQEIAERIIGEDIDEKIAWKKAIEYSKNQLTENKEDIDARFNLSVSYYKLGDYQKSIDEFEKVEYLLSFRTLWYQIEPILAYYELGKNERVLQITERILNNQNRAFSELYILRGKIYQKQGNLDAARSEFQKAVDYNINLKEAQNLLNSL